MKSLLRTLIVFLLLLALVACSASDQTVRMEQQQQGAGTLAIVNNQPVPDLGGWSFERSIVISTYLARNRTIATYAYTMTFDGRVIEICPSIGYPIPYSTQLTNPQQFYTSGGGVIAQPEPNGLYPPATAAATLVQCANPDGTVSPTYFEQDVFALPYRIQADLQLVRVDEQTSFSVPTGKP